MGQGETQRCSPDVDSAPRGLKAKGNPPPPTGVRQTWDQSELWKREKWQHRSSEGSDPDDATTNSFVYKSYTPLL